MAHALEHGLPAVGDDGLRNGPTIRTKVAVLFSGGRGGLGDRPPVVERSVKAIQGGYKSSGVDAQAGAGEGLAAAARIAHYVRDQDV